MLSTHLVVNLPCSSRKRQDASCATCRQTSRLFQVGWECSQLNASSRACMHKDRRRPQRSHAIMFSP